MGTERRVLASAEDCAFNAASAFSSPFISRNERLEQIAMLSEYNIVYLVYQT
jgi:hypothetical protein